MFVKFMEALSLYAVPFLLLSIPLYGFIKKVKVYEVFTDGAKEGFTTAVRIIPFLVAMLVAIGVFRESGAMELMTKALAPVTALIGIPADVFPMAIMRPLSGGGAQGMMIELFKSFGPDSMIGRMASVMMGSTETTCLRTSCVLWGCISEKKHAMPYLQESLLMSSDY